MTDSIRLSAAVTEDFIGFRVDQAAARLFPDYSRARLQTWIKQGQLLVDGRSCRPSDKLSGAEKLTLETLVEPDQRWQPQAMALDIVFEDDSLIVLNKAAGVVVHPAAGHADGTLVNALLSHCADLAELPRAGIVHRLDRDTTGLMVVAKTLPAHHKLVRQLQARSVHREYEAVVQGSMTGGGMVDAPIGRHPRQRTKMAVVERGGKEAVTHYRLIKRYRDYSHVRCLLETGRTHQIRVHMAHIHHPLVGDPLYAGRWRQPAGAGDGLLEALAQFPRQALHARALELDHPLTGDTVRWESSLPTDMLALLAALDADPEQRR